MSEEDIGLSMSGFALRGGGYGRKITIAKRSKSFYDYKIESTILCLLPILAYYCLYELGNNLHHATYRTGKRISGAAFRFSTRF
jgi:hypothetical protein